LPPTKLFNDVYQILLDYKRLQPSTIADLLETREEYQNEDDRKLAVHIVRVLKKLVDEELVNKRVRGKNAWYNITDKGVKEASLRIPCLKIQASRPQKMFEIDVSKILNPITDRERMLLFKGKETSGTKILQTFDDITPKGKANVNASFYLDAHKEKIDNATRIFTEKTILQSVTSNLVLSIQQAIIDSTKNVYSWKDPSEGPPQIEKMINRLKSSLDFEAMILLHFNGKRLVEEYPWEEELHKLKRIVDADYKNWPKTLVKINTIGKARDSWVQWKIIEQLYEIDREVEVFDNLTSAIGKNVEMLVNRFSEHIVGMQKISKMLHDGPNPAQPDEISRNLEEMINDGSIEVCVTFKINKEKIQEKRKKVMKDFLKETGNPLI